MDISNNISEVKAKPANTSTYHIIYIQNKNIHYFTNRGMWLKCFKTSLDTVYMFFYSLA